MSKRASIAAALAAGVLVGNVCIAQGPRDANQIANDLKNLERCHEFGGGSFSHNGERAHHAYRYANMRFDGDLMHYTKYLVTRIERPDGTAGVGHVYDYVVRLSDLAPEPLAINETHANGTSTGIWEVDVRCRNNAHCFTRNETEIRSANGLVSAETWERGQSVTTRQSGVAFHTCAIRGHATSRELAQQLRQELHMLINQVTAGVRIGHPIAGVPGPAPGFTPSPFPPSSPSAGFPPSPFPPSSAPAFPPAPAPAFPGGPTAGFPAAPPTFPPAPPPAYPAAPAPMAGARIPAAPYFPPVPGAGQPPLQSGPGMGTLLPAGLPPGSTRAPLF